MGNKIIDNLSSEDYITETGDIGGILQQHSIGITPPGVEINSS